jgi:hypothetical protein
MIFNKLRQTAGSIKIEKKFKKINSFIQTSKQSNRSSIWNIGSILNGDTFNFDFNLNRLIIFLLIIILTIGFEYDDEINIMINTLESSYKDSDKNLASHSWC